MKLHYGGKYKNPQDLKNDGILPENAVIFREPDMRLLSIIGNIGAIVVLAVLTAIVYLICKPDFRHFMNQNFTATLLFMALLIPHEILHALCFREDVYLYNGLSMGLLFIYGTESMSKARFIFMSLLPNLVLGVVPFVLFLVHPDWSFLGLLGAFCISGGFGDYILPSIAKHNTLCFAGCAAAAKAT